MRHKSEKVIERNRDILERIQGLKSEHPFWGYRRIWAYLKFVEGLDINKKRILRLMREYGLLVKPNMRLKATRVAPRPKPRPSSPNEWWGIDMTKAIVGNSGWVYIVIVLDWYTKKVVGYHIGERAKAGDWRNALEMAVNRQFPEGAHGQGLNLMSDNGCQPTSIAFMEACSVMGIHQAFTSYNNPKGNADTERMMRTIKEELLWLREWSSAAELKTELTEWFIGYNASYLHSTLGYKTPEQFEAEYKTCPCNLQAGNSCDTLLLSA